MTEQEQRTLLELAAKAAEYDVIYEAEYLTFFRRDVQGRPIWNPLTDDGDALRLAVKLGIDVFPWQNKVHDQRTIGIEAATRLAIVRAAAEIGKRMEAKP